MPGCILFPPLVVHHTAPVAQEIGVPVLAAADAAVARLESADTPFHLIIGAREILPVVTLHQVRPQVSEHLQELGQTWLLLIGKAAITQVPGHLLTPPIHAASHCRISHSLSSCCHTFL